MSSNTFSVFFKYFIMFFTVCDAGVYMDEDGDCTMVCGHCADDANCDPGSGLCPDDCDPGWNESHCSQSMYRLSMPLTCTHCWFGVGPPSATLAKHQTSNGCTSSITICAGDFCSIFFYFTPPI